MSNTFDDISDSLCEPDIFVEGIASIDRIAGDCTRMTLYATRERGERVVVARIVWPPNLAAAAYEQWRAFVENGAFLTASAPEGRIAN